MSRANDTFVGETTRYVVNKAPCRVILTAPPADRYHADADADGDGDDDDDDDGAADFTGPSPKLTITSSMPTRLAIATPFQRPSPWCASS